MHDEAAGKIHQSPVRQPATAPDPVRDRDIDHKQPQATKQHHAGEGDAFRIGTDDQRRRDDGECHLEHEKHNLGDRTGRAIDADAGQEGLVQTADPGVEGSAVTKSEAIAEGQPKNRHQAADRHTVHEHGQDVSGMNQPTIKQGKAWQRHKENQSGRHNNPCRIRTRNFGRGLRKGIAGNTNGPHCNCDGNNQRLPKNRHDPS